MLSIELKKSFEKGSKSFGWQQRNPALASMRKGEFLIGMGMSGSMYGSDNYIVAALFSDGYLLIYGGETNFDHSFDTAIARVAAITFNLRPENIFIALCRSLVPTSLNLSIQLSPRQQDKLIVDLINSLQREIKNIALTGQVKIFGGRTPNDLMISNGFLKDHGNNNKIPISKLLEQSDLKVVEARIAPPNYIQEQNNISLSYAAHFVEIMMQPGKGKIKLSKMVAVIDAGKIQDLMAVASHLNNALNIEFDKIAIKKVTDKNLHIETYQGFSNFMNTLLAERPATEIIFINPANTIDERQPSNLSELTNFHLNGFSCALQNAIHHATGWREYKS